MRYLFIFILALLPGTNSFSRPDANLLDRSSHSETTKKPKKENRIFGTLKLSPIQVLTCEIPISFEFYRLNKKSIQLQVGYIFKGPGFHGFGPDGTDINKGLLSYRISPYSNDGGINIKIEFRNYKFSLKNNYKVINKSFYYAPQLMYKFSYYKNQSHWLKSGIMTLAYRLTESKKSNVFGAGFIIGNQKIYNRFVVDWSAGFGLRLRSMKINISELYLGPSRTEYPNVIEDYTSFYPFINLGVKLGLKL